MTWRVIIVMDLTIEQLTNRIIYLEKQIHILLSSKVRRVKRSISSGFKLFEQTFIPHVRTSLYYKHFIVTGNYNFQPKFSDIIKEISAMWNAISYDEKLHWIS